MSSDMTVVLASGGTGGHLFPAFALAEVLQQRGAAVKLFTDPRGAEYGQEFDFVERTIIPSMGLFRTSKLQQIKGVFALGRGYMKARSLLSKIKPAAVVGFGGYASAPTVWAAQHMGIPTLMHEQNSVMGRANRLLSKNAKQVCLSFPNTQGLEGFGEGRTTLVGNPVRKNVVGLSAYAAPNPGEPFRIFVYGGSQGAAALSKMVPDALAQLSEHERSRIDIRQQARPEDMQSLGQRYKELGINAELATFFSDMPENYRQAHLVICRSGASSVAEVATVGRPCVFVPLPTAVDDQQTLNARSLTDADAAWLQPQGEQAASELSALLSELLVDPLRLDAVAKRALAQSHANAANALADCLYSHL